MPDAARPHKRPSNRRPTTNLAVRQYRHLYDSIWNAYGKRRRSQMEFRFCAECKKLGRTTLSAVTDHIIPHRGDIELFWDVSNHQDLCIPHHNAKTAREDGGFGNKRKGQHGGSR